MELKTLLISLQFLVSFIIIVLTVMKNDSADIGFSANSDSIVSSPPDIISKVVLILGIVFMLNSLAIAYLETHQSYSIVNSIDNGGE